MSVCSLQRPSHHPAGGHYALARPSAQPHHRTGLGSVLGGGAPSYHPAATARPGYGAGDSQAAHSQVEVAVNRAEVRYRKALSTPIFTLSVRDSLGRLVELPIDTHPGHYRRETSTIHSSAIVKLATQLQHIPPGARCLGACGVWHGEGCSGARSGGWLVAGEGCDWGGRGWLHSLAASFCLRAL